jgi:hypothetical protein
MGRDNPLLIGYMLTNEIPTESVAVFTPGLAGTYAIKRRLVEFLRERHSSVAELNAAWEMEVKTFKELVDLKFSATTRKARADMDAFLVLYCETYGRLLRDTFKKHDPNHMLLGHRWLPHTAAKDTVVKHLSKYLDVISINYYCAGTPDADYLRHIHKVSGGKPILLSEWSYGCDDRGHSGGCRDVDSQHERGLHYRNYVEQAAALPFVAGHQWFTYVDQAITGRTIGDPETSERMQIGLVDVTDRPYREFLDEVAKTNHQIYDVVFGKVKPYKLPEDIARKYRPGPKRRVTIPRRTSPITIDGAMHEWPMVAPTLTLSGRDRVEGSEAAAGKISAEVWLQWDPEHLYVVARIVDPSPMASRAVQEGASGLWNGDAIELFLSVRANDKTGPLTSGDYQIGISSGNKERALPPLMWNWTLNAPIKGGLAAGKLLDGAFKGYVLETRIPFASLEGFAAKAGLEIDFDFALDNGDEARMGMRTVQLVWHGTAENCYDRGRWGRAVLAP